MAFVEPRMFRLHLGPDRMKPKDHVDPIGPNFCASSVYNLALCRRFSRAIFDPEVND